MAMADNLKPWWASTTIWASIAAIGAGAGTAYQGYVMKDPATVSAGLSGAWLAVIAIIGRVKADTAIGKVIKSVVPPAA